MTDKRNKKTITSTETDKEVVERVYHLKEIKKLLDEVLEDYINQVAVMNPPAWLNPVTWHIRHSGSNALLTRLRVS